MTFYKILADSAKIICLISSVIGIYKYKVLSKELRIIFYFVVLGAFTELFVDFYKVYIGGNTGIIGHFYISASILVLGCFYHEVLTGFVKTIIIDVLMFLFFTYSIINVLFIQSIHEFPSLLGAIGALILIVFSILFFARIMTEAKIQKLRNEPLVWINVCILFYYAGSFFYFILFNLNVTSSIDFARQAIIFPNLLMLFFYITIAIILFKVQRKKVIEK